MSPSATPDLNVTGVTPAPANATSPASLPGGAPALLPSEQAAGNPVRIQAFPAVLLALKASGTRATPALVPGTSPSLPAASTAAADPAEPPPFVLSLPVPVIGSAAREPASALRETATDGATLPADGTALPPGVELELLLSSLGSASLAATAGPLVTPTSVATDGGSGITTGRPGADTPVFDADTRPRTPRQTSGRIAPAPDASELLAALTGDGDTDPIGSTTTHADNSPNASVARSAEILLPSLDLTLAPARPDAGSPSLMRSVVSLDGSAIVTPITVSPPPATSGGAQTSNLLALDVLPVLEPMADADTWSRSLGERLLMMSENGLQSARLKLHPEHLGPLDIRISVDDDGATRVSFSAHHPQTRDALENAIPRLRELFADQGLNLAHANVDSGRGAFAQRELPSAAPGWNDWSGDDGEARAVVQDVTAWRLGRSSDRRVDIFV